MEFETITMKENESFDTSHSKFKDIVNSLYNLSEIFSKSRVVKKVLQSLPDRFLLKITAIEESKDLDSLTENELISFLQTFESNQVLKYKTQKNKAYKTIAFRAKDKNIAKSNEYYVFDFQEIANFECNFNKIVKLNQKSGNCCQNFGKLGKGNVENKLENKPQSSNNCFESR